jgi:hypothetical protein
MLVGLAIGAVGGIALSIARSADVAVPVAARDLQPFEAIDASATTVAKRPASQRDDPASSASGPRVVEQPLAVGQPIVATAGPSAAAPARPGDIIVTVALGEDAPVRTLLRPGLDVDLLLSRPDAAPRGDGAIVEDVRVLAIGPAAITLSVPPVGREAIADVGTSNMTIAVPAG